MSTIFNFFSAPNLISGAEPPADILADARDFAFDAFGVLSLLH